MGENICRAYNSNANTTKAKIGYNFHFSFSTPHPLVSFLPFFLFDLRILLGW